MIIERLAADLGLTTQFVSNLSNAAAHHYKTYSVKKKNGGLRIIDHPSRRLKSAQTWILQNVLVSLPVHDAASAYRPGKSILQHAAVHSSAKFLLRLDMKDFFPSITSGDFETYIMSNPAQFAGWTPSDVASVARLLFKGPRMTIGAPSSPALSNALCFELDGAISSLALGRDVRYTRYADDLFFSAHLPNLLGGITEAVAGILRTIGVPKNLQLNLSKTVHSSKKGNRQVTGITLGSDGLPHVPRQYKRWIRSLIHKFDSLNDLQKESLTGMISYVSGLEPDFTNSLVKKYGYEQFKRVTAVKTLLDRQALRIEKQDALNASISAHPSVQGV